MTTRRTHLMGFLTTLLSACSANTGLGMGNAPRPDPNDPDAALKYKFRGLLGGEKCVSAVQGFSTSLTIVYTPEGYAFANGTFGTGFSTSSYGVGGTDRLVIPRYLKMVRYPKGAKLASRTSYKDLDKPIYVGASEFEIDVPVAERIPEDLLEDLRRDPKGTLRLKLRIHPQTLLIGWDIERRPGYDPKKLDQWGEISYVGPVHSFAGGDFREAQIFNGKAVRKGWYIDPRTKARIETDY